METKLFSHDHSVLFIEKLEVYLKEEEVCSGCEKPVFGPGYICSQCDFLLHKACTELPHEVKSLLHPSHSLALLPTHAAGTICCDACGKLCDRCFVYHCSLCNFNLDTQCASQRQISANDCHQHAFAPILQQMQFTCEACGEERNDKAHLCGICQLLVEHACARCPRTIKTTVHDHNLSLIFSFHQVIRKHDNDKIFCEVCYQDVNTEYATYYCHDCNFAAHLNCAGHFEEKMARGSRPYLAEEVAGLYHKHELILNKEELRYEKFCDGCMLLISSAPFYSCEKCNFFLHERCGKVPRIKRHRLHKHLLTLVSHVPSKYGLFECNACNRYRRGFIYRCDHCNYNLDLPCFTVPEALKHDGHPHSLHLPLISDEKCSACGFQANDHSFVCTATDCKFVLCFVCVTLPLVARHPYDTHELNLTYAAEDDSEEYYCLICEKKRNSTHWFYYCKECNFPCHPNCVLEKYYPYTIFGKTYEDEDHPHSLTLVQKSKNSPPCDSCDNPFDGVALECTQCKFIVHPEGKFLGRTSTPWTFWHVEL